MKSISRWRVVFWATPDPSDQELSAYLRRELPWARQNAIRRLLDRDVGLRVRLAELARSLGTVPGEDAGGDSQLLSVDQAWTALKRRLDEYTARKRAGGLRLLTDCSEPPAWQKWRFADWRRAVFGALVYCLVLLLIGLQVTTVPASAMEVLARASEAEAAAFGGVVRPVVHQRLEIRRSGGPGEAAGQGVHWEFWRTADSGQLAERLHLPDGSSINPASPPPGRSIPTVFSELAAVFRDNGIERHSVLSAAAYRAWRGRIGARQDVAREPAPDGSDAYVVRTPVPQARSANAIFHSELVVRARDWRPVARRLRVYTAGGIAAYEIFQLQFEVVAFTSLPRRLFEAVPDAAPHVLASAPAARPKTPSDPPAVVRAPEWSAAVQALHRLHRAGLCDHRRIRVAATPGGVQIRGTVPSQDQKRAIEAILGTFDNASIAVDPAAGGQEDQARWASFFETALQPAFAPQPIPEALRISLQSLQEGIEFDLAAVEQLATAFPPAEVRELPAADRRALEEMLRQHLVALEANMQQFASLLTEAPAAPAAAAGLDAAEQDPWNVRLPAVARMVRRWLFPAGSPDPAYVAHTLGVLRTFGPTLGALRAEMSRSLRSAANTESAGLAQPR